MVEGRVRKYGRNLAIMINHVISTLPGNQREDYKRKFLQELDNYDFSPRKKGEPRNKGCTWELDNIEEIDMENPEDFARLIKEGAHLMYLKPTARRFFKALKENL